MNVPVYAEILFDAIEAEAAGDFRKAILYSAIAVEAMAATRIDEEFSSRCKSPSDLRRVVFPVNGGQTVEKDPVFDQLREDSKRKFKLLLHEVPLYVTRKSILLEDEALYRELLDLHSARNDLAHSGVVDEASGRWTVDYPGAKRALDVAIRAYDWFGASGRYVTMHGHELNGYRPGTE